MTSGIDYDKLTNDSYTTYSDGSVFDRIAMGRAQRGGEKHNHFLLKDATGTVLRREIASECLDIVVFLTAKREALKRLYGTDPLEHIDKWVVMRTCRVVRALWEDIMNAYAIPEEYLLSCDDDIPVGGEMPNNGE